MNNWGRWGPDDQLGTLNLITDEVRRRAARCVGTGRAFPLGLALSEAEGIQKGIVPGRFNPVRTMSYVNVALSDDPDWICSNEDVVVMPLQCATHWDGLAHVSYGGKIYNGFPQSSVTSAGASRCGIHLVDTLVGRGVLLDVARAKGVDVLDGGYAIQPADLDAACELGGVRIEPGDIVLVRTGQMARLKMPEPVPGRRGHRARGEHARLQQRPHLHGLLPGALDDDGRVVPHPGRGRRGHRHPGPRGAALRGQGHLPPRPSPAHRGDGDDPGPELAPRPLAADCAEDGVYSFFLDATPLPFTNGLGSPVNPVALK